MHRISAANSQNSSITTRISRKIRLVIICSMLWMIYSSHDVLTARSADQALGSNEPEHIVLTWQSDARTSLSITWRTSPDVLGTVVEYMPSERFIGFADEGVLSIHGDRFLFGTDIGTMAIHEAELTGLLPGTSYTYRVGDGSRENWSDPQQFHTEPHAAEPFTFLFMSDTQAYPNRSVKNGYGIWAEMLRLGLQAAPEASFLLLSGDIVDYGDQQTQWELWFDAAADLLPTTPIVPTVGNHDVVRSGEDNFRAQFQLPRNGPASEVELAYSFDYGDMHMAVLNTEGDLELQAVWLLQDMASSDKKWKIAAFHRSPYHSHHARASRDVREAWTQVFDEAGVDLILSGHDHAYMRSWPMRDGEKKQDGEGTVYIIGGTAGSKFYEMGEYPWMRVAFDEDIQLVSSISIDGDRLSMQVLTRDGRVADAFTMVKGGGTTTDFLDLPATHWAYRTIMNLHQEGIVQGISETRFAPERTISRAEFVTMLVRAMGWSEAPDSSASFIDVKPDDWFADEVHIVNHRNIVQGVDVYHFAPDRKLTREEMAVITVRAYEYANARQTHGSDDRLSVYTDRSELAAWSAQRVNEALHYGLMNGLPDGRFAPRKLTSRAEAAQVIDRLVMKMKEAEL